MSTATVEVVVEACRSCCRSLSKLLSKFVVVAVDIPRVVPDLSRFFRVSCFKMSLAHPELVDSMVLKTQVDLVHHIP